jgi:hypothetical protein
MGRGLFPSLRELPLLSLEHLVEFRQRVVQLPVETVSTLL